MFWYLEENGSSKLPILWFQMHFSLKSTFHLACQLQVDVDPCCHMQVRLFCNERIEILNGLVVGKDNFKFTTLFITVVSKYRQFIRLYLVVVLTVS